MLDIKVTNDKDSRREIINGSLREAIRLANESCGCGHVNIFIVKKMHIKLESELVLNKTITLFGNGSTIEATKGRHFAIHSEGITTFKSLTLKGGKDLYGGSINSKSLRGTLILEDVDISHNRAEYGGAIYSFGNLILRRSKAEHNTALKQGGALWCHKDLILEESKIKHNSVLEVSSDNYGGGVVIDDGNATLIKSTISENKVNFNLKEKNGGNSGGIILMAGSLNLYDSAIDRNEAYSSGGVQMGNGDINLFNSSISKNKSFVDGDATGGGGIVIMVGNVTLNKSRISDNTTRGMYSGSLVSFIGNVTVNDSTISNNVNRGPGGAIASNFNSTVTVNRSKLLNNTGASLGGAIVNFSNNLGEISVNETEIFGNTLTNEQLIGQTIAAFLNVIIGAKNQSDTNASKSINPSTGEINGGASKLINSLKDLEGLARAADELLKKITFAKYAIGGGAIATLLKCPINIHKSHFTNNFVAKKVTEKNCRFEGYGGALFTINSLTTIGDAIFGENKSTSFASAIFNDSQLIVNNSEFLGNKAEKDFTITNGENGNALIANSKFKDNNCIDIHNKGRLVLINTNVSVSSTNEYIKLN